MRTPLTRYSARPLGLRSGLVSWRVRTEFVPCACGPCTACTVGTCDALAVLDPARALSVRVPALASSFFAPLRTHALRRCVKAQLSHERDTLTALVDSFAAPDAFVRIVAARYVRLFNSLVSLCVEPASTADDDDGERDEGEGEESGTTAALIEREARAARASDHELVFAGAAKVRTEFERLLNGIVRSRDASRGKAFVRVVLQDILLGLSVGPASHPRSQAEIGHYSESLRRVS